jgi:hypothetical protein
MKNHHFLTNKFFGSTVAAWLSETVLRGRGPGASGFKSHRRGKIFSKEGTSGGPWMCVYVFQADGRVVEGRATLFRHHREVSRVRIPGRMASHGCLCLYSCCGVQKKEKGEERVAWWPGKVPRSPAAPHKKKRRKTSRPQGT